MPSPKSTAPARRMVRGTGVSRLVRYDDSGAATPLPLVRGVTFGRGDGDDTRVSDPRMSEAHFSLRRTDDTWSLHDQDSTNGTFVNGERATTRYLADGDVIRAGDTLFVFEHCEPGTDANDPRAAATQRLDETLEHLRHTRLPLLLLGPTGAGKGFLARQIAGPATRQINCAALPETLIESEIFGHTKNAFSGAGAAKPGLIESADGGTLFLDEIGAASPNVQAKLLKVLEDNETRRVGSVTPIKVDVRFIAATSARLGDAIASGAFRPDLLYRLGQIVDVPALAARRVDIPGLLRRFTGRSARASFTPELLEAVLVHDWPGNVRELELLARVLAERARASGDGDSPHAEPLDVDALPDEMTAFLFDRFDDAPAPAERSAPSADELRALLNRNDGNVSASARELGVHRNQLNRWRRRYGLG